MSYNHYVAEKIRTALQKDIHTRYIFVSNVISHEGMTNNDILISSGTNDGVIIVQLGQGYGRDNTNVDTTYLKCLNHFLRSKYFLNILNEVIGYKLFESLIVDTEKDISFFVRYNLTKENIDITNEVIEKMKEQLNSLPV